MNATTPLKLKVDSDKPLSFKLALSDPASNLSSAGEKAQAYRALKDILHGLGSLLGIENPGYAGEAVRLFSQAPAPQAGRELRVSVVLPNRIGKRQRLISTQSTWESLSGACTAEAISKLPMEDPRRIHLLKLNNAISSAGSANASYRLRIERKTDELTLSNLGLADRTRRDRAWSGEVLVELTDCHYKALTLDAADHRGTPVQLRLRNDESTFRSIVEQQGPIYLRIWAEGFGNCKILRLTRIYEFEFVRPEVFIAGELLFDTADQW